MLDGYFFNVIEGVWVRLLGGDNGGDQPSASVASQ